MWADAQRDGRPAESRWRPQQKFRNFIPCTTTQSLADDGCSSAVQQRGNIGERKTWTQSKFYTWQNSVTGQQPQK